MNVTFTPGTGRFRFLPEEWDVKLGDLLEVVRQASVNLPTLSRLCVPPRRNFFPVEVWTQPATARKARWRPVDTRAPWSGP